MSVVYSLGFYFRVFLLFRGFRISLTTEQEEHTEKQHEDDKNLNPEWFYEVLWHK